MCSLTEKAISKDDKRQPQSTSEGKARSRQPKAVCTSSLLLLAPFLSHLRAERALYAPHKHWEMAVQRSPAVIKQLRHHPAPCRGDSPAGPGGLTASSQRLKQHEETSGGRGSLQHTASSSVPKATQVEQSKDAEDLCLRQ